ncbi:PLDc N-terminal domain-containing protein [uncultured Desulfobacter sp.]|uniref:PLDc N-terminal domain-containing protein n=1 Tax=uncultured Desulfobacter sp. TaxID=240139 RepID=UPI002AAB8E05|nr:PLDc N-terminal domain-containing protein [uncultured Desulfobacter sp.]
MTPKDLVLYILLIVGISFILTVLALIDLLKKDFPSLKEKFVWHLVAIVPIIGWIVYFALGAKKGTRKKFDS